MLSRPQHQFLLVKQCFYIYKAICLTVQRLREERRGYQYRPPASHPSRPQERRKIAIARYEDYFVHICESCTGPNAEHNVQAFANWPLVDSSDVYCFDRKSDIRKLRHKCAVFGVLLINAYKKMQL